MALYKQTEVSLSAWRPCCKAPAETLVAHNPLYLNDLRGRNQKLPVEQPRWDENDWLHELRACNLTYYYPDTGRGSGRESELLRGSFTAITGRIGAGKTTLRVLLGLLPIQVGDLLERPDRYRSG